MNLINRFLILAALIGFAVPSYAADTPPPKSTAQEDFLRFLLTKAEAYSGKVEDAVGKAIDTVQAETPETLRQFLLWRAWKHGINALLPLLVLISLVGVLWFLRRGWLKADKERDDITPWVVCFGVSCVLGLILTPILLAESVIPNLLSFIQIQVAPRIYLLEEVAKLIK